MVKMLEYMMNVLKNSLKLNVKMGMMELNLIDKLIDIELTMEVRKLLENCLQIDMIDIGLIMVILKKMILYRLLLVALDLVIVVKVLLGVEVGQQQSLFYQFYSFSMMVVYLHEYR
jgi:hypothetical protein